MKQIVYATTNPGKFNEAKRNYREYGIEIISPLDLNLNIEVDETGETLEANAALKAEAYIPYVSSDTIVLGDDTGIFIDALAGEPGIKVRRWKGYKMTDEEIIEYTLERLKGVEAQNRTAKFRIAIAVAAADRSTKIFIGEYQTNILEVPLSFREPGFPFRPIITDELPTHRISAIKASLPYLSTLLH